MVESKLKKRRQLLKNHLWFIQTGSLRCLSRQNCVELESNVCLERIFKLPCMFEGMRKGTNYTAGLPTITSTVAVLDDPSPALFTSLTQQPMPKLRYSILRFPVVEELAAHRHRHRHHHRHDHRSQQGVFCYFFSFQF